MLEHATENEMNDDRNIPRQASLQYALRSFQDKLIRKDRRDLLVIRKDRIDSISSSGKDRSDFVSRVDSTCKDSLSILNVITSALTIYNSGYEHTVSKENVKFLRFRPQI